MTPAARRTAALFALMLAACSSTPQKPLLPAQDPLADLISQKTAVPPAPAFFNQPAPSVAQTGYAANPNVQAFIRHQTQNGLDAQYLADFFARAGYRANIIGIMNRPATTRPWYVFQKNNAGAQKIGAGRTFYQQNRAALDNAAARYGVPAPLIAAIIGIETDYGKNMGSIPVADALATLAFDYPRRGEFFQKELGEFLQLAQQQGLDPLSYKGSFAGAMGMVQFMPSSFRKWAADGDGDGRIDIWNNVSDAAASAANYMKQHGWQTGRPMLVEAAVEPNPQTDALADAKTALNHTVGDLRRMGVQPLSGSLSDSEPALLYRLETAPGQYRYYIGLQNFHTVWQYNHSKMYVTAVRDIANGIGNGGL